MIELILPRFVLWAEEFGDPPDAVLLPGEDWPVQATTSERRRAYTTARHCARRALGRLGLPPQAIPKNLDGTPRWPSAVVGSLTHCVGYRAAAVSTTSLVAALGIDAEPNIALRAGTLTAVADRPELANLDSLSSDGIHPDRLLICAKESAYKAWFSMTRSYRPFPDVVIEFAPGQRTFTAQVRHCRQSEGGACPTEMTGSWTASEGLLLTAVVAPRAKALPPPRERNGVVAIDDVSGPFDEFASLHRQA
ncbi:4'-phosphopantetheinyl transferase [Jatrophihabitans sp. GAS493]|uniref:4'-phosphopantetheinyl transferase family protein n=1 Tax=Jatrophihabitans sp. GAS493 TaxID=1907575 RepID=UPI001561A7EE